MSEKKLQTDSLDVKGHAETKTKTASVAVAANSLDINKNFSLSALGSQDTSPAPQIFPTTPTPQLANTTQQSQDQSTSSKDSK